MPKPPSIKSTNNERQREDFDSRAPLGETILRRLYSYMLKCRMVEERIRLLFRQGRFSGNYFAAVGQEATEVGATMDLLAEDTIAPSHRNFVTHIMKGTPLTLMFAHIFLRKDSPDPGRCAQAHCGYAPLNIISPASTIAAQLAARTSRVVVVHEANRTLGIGAEVSAIIAEEAFDCLDAPIARVTAPDIPAIPACPPLEKFYMPSVEKIAATLKRTLDY